MKAAAPRVHPNPVLLYTLVGLMQTFWTANFLIGKIALRSFPAPLLAGLRVLVAALCVLPIYFWKVHGRGQWTRRDLPILLTLGLIGIGMNQVLFVIGLSKTSVAHSAFVISTTPISVLLLAAARKLERLTWRKLAGMLMALGGVVVLSLEKRGGGPATLAGDVITFLAGMAFATYTVLGKEVTRKYDVHTVNSFLFGAGALCVLPLVIWEGWSFPFSQVSATGWLTLIYMGLFPSLICYMIFYYALGYIAASRLTTLAYVQPVAATAFGVLLLDEPVTTSLIAGGAAIFTGIYVTERG